MRAFPVACLALSALAVTASAQAPPEPPARFPSAVEEMLVDVVVDDRDGAPVGGLRREDFVLAENGVPQAIASFEAVELAPASSTRDPLAPRPTVSANPRAGDPAPGRTFLVLFDDLRLTVAQGESARRALQDFLRTRVDDEDRLLLVTTGSPTWWGARVGDGRDDLEVLIEGLRGRFVPEVVGDSMSDAEAFRIVVQRDAETFYHVLRRFKRMVPREIAAPVTPVVGFLDGTECTGTDPDKPIVCATANATYQRAVAQLRDSLGIVERSLAALSGVRGRKAAILVSPGFYHDTDLVVGQVDIRSLAFRDEEGRSLASLDLAFTTVGRDGANTEHSQRVDMKLLPATREKLTRDGYVVTHEIELPAGVHQARMVVRDVATGRIGSVSHRIDIPAPGSFRISTPLVSDTLEPVPKGTPPRLAPIARREFTAGSRVFLSLDVFGAERGDVTGRPRVSMGYEVIRPDGGVLTRLQAKPIDPTPEGALHRVVGFTLEDAGAGEYRIEGEVVDQQTGMVLLFTEPFTLRGSSG